MKTKTPKYWKQYKLLDFGNGVKVERFNNIVTIRPETNAVNNLSKKLSFWQQKADYIYDSKTVDGGKWNVNNASEWYINYKSDNIEAKFKLQLSNSKHIGIFPEQAVNWEFITSRIKPSSKILNLFAYTGAISVISAIAGGEVTHIDSSKTAIKQAKENAEINHISNIRFIIDDAFLFAKKEEKRANKYDFIILDPPTYGFGAKGKSWKINKDLEPLLQVCKNILNKNGVVILNTYTPKFSFKQIIPILEKTFTKKTKIEFGSLALKDSFEKELILSDYYIIKTT